MSLGNSLAIVSAVYVAILLPWAFLYLHDFISERWNSIARTRANGVIHLIVVLIPLPYIVYYIVQQAALPDPDYKEMFAAITAAVFSVYHFARTAWGLYQLRRFYRWAVATALVMQSAGYAPTPARVAPAPAPSWRGLLQRTARLPPPRSPHPPPAAPTPPTTTAQHGLSSDPASVPAVPAPAPVDDDHVEDGLHHVATPRTCSVHDFNIVSGTCSLSDAAPRSAACAARAERVGELIDQMLINSSIVDNEFISSYAPWRVAWSGKLRPLHRKSTLVRWTVAYLAHFGKEWLADCSTKQFSEQSWNGRRCNLACKVWATAALRMETTCRRGLAAAFSSSSHHRWFRENSATSSFLDPCQWERVTSEVEEQIFDKEHVLKESFVSGLGLPYACPIIDSRDEPLPSHGLYRPLLKEAVESLPTRYYEDAESITSEHIEWFAAFLWVEQWAGCVSDDQLPAQSGNLSDTQVVPAPSNAGPSALQPYDTPVRVLQDQLGLEVPLSLQMCAFPAVSNGYGPVLWDNRSVLQVSAHIDNWIGLTAGGELAALLETEAQFAPMGAEFEKAHCQLTSEQVCLEQQNANRSRENRPGYVRSTRIIEFHRVLEIRRLRSQLGDRHPKHCHLEHGLSFMGCVLESTRSGIAEYLFSNGPPTDSGWKPPVPSGSLSFGMSEQLRQCLISVFDTKTKRHRFDSSVKERLLWECQNGVQENWHNMQVHSYQGQQTSSVLGMMQAILLCLLGFPSLQVEYRSTVEESNDSQTRPLSFEIWPVAGPQRLGISVKVDLSTANLILRMVVADRCGDVLNAQFHWQDWRDAFEGRLIGKSEWQKTHYMRELPIRRTNAKISKGIRARPIVRDDDEKTAIRKCFVWEGWKPFRAGMTLFELRHSSLIIIGDSIPTDTDPADRATKDAQPSSQDRNAYETASMAALADASVHLDSFLTLNNNLFDEEEDLADDDPQVLLSIPNPLVEHAHQSPESSGDESAIRAHFGIPKPLPRDVIRMAQEQDPKAMHLLATWVLTGTKELKKNKQKALQLLERALVLGRNINTAKLLVKTLINPDKGEGSLVDVERALAAVELLWRDFARRHTYANEDGKIVRRWTRNPEAWATRMATLAQLHLKLVKLHPTAEMMRNLGDRLSLWGNDDKHHADLLYESAILAAQDGRAMMELGRNFHTRDAPFAARLYLRSMMAGVEDAAVLLTDLITETGLELITEEEKRVTHETAARKGHHLAMREHGLRVMHGIGYTQDRVRGQLYVERGVYGLGTARARAQGIEDHRLSAGEIQRLVGEAVAEFRSREAVRGRVQANSGRSEVIQKRFGFPLLRSCCTDSSYRSGTGKETTGSDVSKQSHESSFRREGG